MKSEEQIRNDLINKLREQADRLQRGTPEAIIDYKTVRTYIEVLEDVLELNVLNNAPGGATEIFKDRRD